METTTYRARPKYWADVEAYVENASESSTDHCLVELRGRIEKLEATMGIKPIPGIQQVKNFFTELPTVQELDELIRDIDRCVGYHDCFDQAGAPDELRHARLMIYRLRPLLQAYANTRNTESS